MRLLVPKLRIRLAAQGRVGNALLVALPRRGTASDGAMSTMRLGSDVRLGSTCVGHAHAASGLRTHDAWADAAYVETRLRPLPIPVAEAVDRRCGSQGA